MVSTLKITFPQNFLAVNDYVEFTAKGQVYRVGWVSDENGGTASIRGLFDIIAASEANYNYANYDALNYKKSIEKYDYLDAFTVSSVGNIVTIQSEVSGLFFSNTVSNNVGVSFLISNGIVLDSFTIDSQTFVSGDCSDVLVDVVFSEIPKRITSPFIDESPTKTINFSYIRGAGLKITAESNTGKIASLKFKTPPKLLGLNIDLSIVNSDITNSATINYEDTFNDISGLEITYSIDGVNYGTSNTFVDLSAGTYNAYVKDKYDCVVSKPFEILAFQGKTPYIKISKVNPIRVKLDEEWNGIDIYKNDENTLSCEALDKVLHSEKQRWQTNDIVPFQFKSNYETHTVSIIDEDLEVNVPVNKVREYLGRRDNRDCVIYSIGDGRCGLYFDVGNTYDYDTGIKNGNYQLYGDKPNWLRVGTYLELEDVGVLEIKETFFDEEKDSKILVIDYNYTGSPTIKKVKSTYNLRNFDLYEFKVDFSSYEDKEVKIKISFEDSVFNSVDFISEIQEVKKNQTKCLEIAYGRKDKQNTSEIFFETGIFFKLRQSFESIEDNPVSEIEIHKGDTEVSVLNTEYYEGDTITFSPTTKEHSKTLELALMHPDLTINKVEYRLSEKSEKEKEDDSNLYTVKANLIKADGGINTTPSFTPESDVSEIAIPALISTGDGGFIGY